MALTVRKSYIWSNASFLDSALRVETSFSSKVETLTLKVFLLSSSSSWVPVCAPHIGWKGPILVWQLTIFGIKQQCLSTYSWKLEKRFKTFRIFLRIFFRIFFRIFLAIFIEIYFSFFFYKNMHAFKSYSNQKVSILSYCKMICMYQTEIRTFHPLCYCVTCARPAERRQYALDKS